MTQADKGLRLNATEVAITFSPTELAHRYPPILTVRQTAELLQVPQNTIYDWSSRGLLAGCARRVGKHLRVYRDRLIHKVFNEGINHGK